LCGFWCGFVVVDGWLVGWLVELSCLDSGPMPSLYTILAALNFYFSFSDLLLLPWFYIFSQRRLLAVISARGGPTTY